MKGRKVILKEYKVERPNEKGEKNQEDYRIVEVMVNVMLHPSQQHKGFRFYTVDKVAKKIADCDSNSIILDTKDYEVLKECFDNFKGFGKNDAELVRRVYEAEEIDVAEKKKK